MSEKKQFVHRLQNPFFPPSLLETEPTINPLRLQCVLNIHIVSSNLLLLPRFASTLCGVSLYHFAVSSCKWIFCVKAAALSEISTKWKLIGAEFTYTNELCSRCNNHKEIIGNFRREAAAELCIFGDGEVDLYKSKKFCGIITSLAKTGGLANQKKNKFQCYRIDSLKSWNWPGCA